jgi:hypothetical protein
LALRSLQFCCYRQLTDSGAIALSARQDAAAFATAPPERVAELLETLVTLGQARGVADGQYAVG